jgi:hypothetical protein
MRVLYSQQILDRARLPPRQWRWEENSTLCRAGSTGADLFIEPVPGSRTVRKYRFDIWQSREFAQALSDWDVDGLIIGGVELICCVLYAVVGAEERGHAYVVPRDLVSGMRSIEQAANQPVRTYLQAVHPTVDRAENLGCLWQARDPPVEPDPQSQPDRASVRRLYPAARSERRGGGYFAYRTVLRRPTLALLGLPVIGGVIGAADRSDGLRSLSFIPKRIEDRRIEPLAELPGLESLDFPTNMFTTRQVAWLTAQLPASVNSTSHAPLVRFLRQPDADGKAEDVLLIGKGKPFLDSVADGARIRKHVVSFERMVDEFRRDRALKPD